MPFVSITRLKVRALWHLPAFALHTLGSKRQAARAPGFLAGGLAVEKGFCFWTTTVWQDRAAMKAFRNTGAHMKAMPRLIAICDEASYAHWEQDSAEPPTADEMHRRMLAEGKLSKVRKPSPAHVEGKAASERPPGAISRFAPAR